MPYDQKPGNRVDSLEIVSPPDAQGRCLKVRFFRQGDRYAHQIDLCEGRRESLLLSSCEGSDQSAWPLSPPLQQLTVEAHRGVRSVLLLVGQAGRSHWSLSVEPAESAAALTFDVACRVRQQPDWLGSSYQWESPLTVSVTPRAAELGWPDPRCRLAALTDGIANSLIEPAGDRRLHIAPSPAAGPLPRTVRWKYRLEIPGLM